MLDYPNNLGIDTYSTAELLAVVRQTLPIVNIFIKASQALLTNNQNPCKTCKKRDICQNPCDQLNAILPKPLEGSSNLNNTVGDLIESISSPCQAKLDRSKLRTIDKTRSEDIFTLYKNCPVTFTKQEWRVITLRIKEGDTFKTIGQKLGIQTSTASDTHQRAKKKMEERYKKRRVISRKNT